MLVGVTLNEISDDEIIEKALMVSGPLQKLVQQHNRIAFEQNNINVVTKEFTGKQLKEELEKHEIGILIGLLHDYINVTKITLNNNVESNGEMEVMVVSKDNNLDPSISIERLPKNIEHQNGDLSNNDKKTVKMYLIKVIINVCAATVLMLLGAGAYIAWQLQQMPSDAIISGIFSTVAEVAKFIFTK